MWSHSRNQDLAEAAMGTVSRARGLGLGIQMYRECWLGALIATPIARHATHGTFVNSLQMWQWTVTLNGHIYRGVGHSRGGLRVNLATLLVFGRKLGFDRENPLKSDAYSLHFQAIKGPRCHREPECTYGRPTELTEDDPPNMPASASRQRPSRSAPAATSGPVCDIKTSVLKEYLHPCGPHVRQNNKRMLCSVNKLKLLRIPDLASAQNLIEANRERQVSHQKP